MHFKRAVKNDFPILTRRINSNPLIYLDNSATSQKPKSVIEAITNYYTCHNANVHRGVHTLSDESTKLWQESKQTIATFFHADSEQLIITRNTTEAVNAIRYGWLDGILEENDVILTTIMEHHSNIVMWQEACSKVAAHLKYIDLKADGTLDLENLKHTLDTYGARIKLVSFTHVSNTLGTLNPVEHIVEMIRSAIPNKAERPKIAVDGAQSAPHMSINFQKLGIDFFVFSGHKMLGPMGIGGLIVKKELLQLREMKPWLFGGGMISSVSLEKTEYNDDIDELFVAGTPDVASAVGLAAACQYLTDVGMNAVLEHDRELVAYALEKLSNIPEITIVGPLSSTNRIGSVAFLYNGVHAHDVAQILDSQGIAVRSGHHCTMPLHTHFGWQATTRASFQVYNTKEDIDGLIVGLAKVREVFKK